jgi:aldose 1-epimerase
LIKIASADYEVGLTPEEGGGVTFLRFRGTDVLRPAVAHRRGPLELSSFPLVPYANRIAHGRFNWSGYAVSLAPNFGDHPHTLHGEGWREAWRLAHVKSDSAVLEIDHRPGEWPWAYAARQTVLVDPQGVTFELELSNLDRSAMPAGLGFHPYFPDRASARLRAQVGHVWLTGEDALPKCQAPGAHFGDWAADTAVTSRSLIDHCHTNWPGQADIALPVRGLKVRMTASPNLHFLHIYSPPGEDYFCVEPVSHRPDAVNAIAPLEEGVVSLHPGGRLSATMRLQVTPL